MTWEVLEADLGPVATGAALLGTGGGGNPYLGVLRMRELLRAGRTVQVLDPDELEDDALVVSAGGMGAPVVSWEKLPQGEEEADAVRALEEHLGRRVDAIAPLEMGGSNSLVALAVGAQLGVPVLDGDGMGRAFPELQMVTYLIYGGSPAPAAVADEKGNRTVISRVADVYALERIARAVTIEYGGHAGLAMCAMTGAAARSTCVPRTLTLALRVGEAIERARRQGEDPVEAVLAVTGGRRIFRGKIVDVDRRLVSGFARGRVALEGFGPSAGESITVDFQNENLIARRDRELVAVVPDLIVLVDLDSGEPLTTEILRYGFRVEVLVLPPSPVLTTPAALRFVGPRAFGHDVDYRPGWSAASACA
jgi:DUF917 family protein